MKSKLLLLLLLCFGIHLSQAQTFTMGKKCRAALESAETALKDKNYDEALKLYESFSSKCKTRDAKEAAATGKAASYNGQSQYSEAIAQADIALDVSKGKSLEGYFQKAVAQNKTGDIEGSKKSLAAVLKLTENNENTKERASNFALIAALYERQLSEVDSAQLYLDKAKSMDPTNVNYLIQEGTMYSSLNDFDRAFVSYDKAKLMDPNNLELAIARSNTRLRMMDSKYGTSKAQELRTKMTNDEKSLLCSDLTHLLSLGYKDMNKELFVALLCNP
jgi:tetratricopeptide (TPR) repeat protein